MAPEARMSAITSRQRCSTRSYRRPGIRIQESALHNCLRKGFHAAGRQTPGARRLPESATGSHRARHGLGCGADCPLSRQAPGPHGRRGRQNVREIRERILAHQQQKPQAALQGHHSEHDCLLRHGADSPRAISDGVVRANQTSSRPHKVRVDAFWMQVARSHLGRISSVHVRQPGRRGRDTRTRWWTRSAGPRGRMSR